MRTAALLPTSGDPLLAAYWLRNYETWRGEVDELLVYVNGDTRSVPLYEAAGARIIGATNERLIHGVALTELVRASDHDAVVLMEDDAFVRIPGVMRWVLGQVAELGAVIATPRGGMSPEVELAAREKWGPEPETPDGSRGYGMWPCFLFARPADLRVADMRCSSLSWQPGEVIPGLGRSFPVEVTTDTMTLVAFQLRQAAPVIEVSQFKETWQKDLAEMTATVGWEPPWFHAGGLANEPQAARPDIGMDNNEGRDWAHRFWWWRRIGHDYREHWERAGLDPDYWTPIVEPWINWEDR